MRTVNSPNKLCVGWNSAQTPTHLGNLHILCALLGRLMLHVDDVKSYRVQGWRAGTDDLQTDVHVEVYLRRPTPVVVYPHVIG